MAGYTQARTPVSPARYEALQPAGMTFAKRVPSCVPNKKKPPEFGGNSIVTI
jgi:hypothetical protein